MPTILLVDDEAFCRSALSRLLEIQGYRVTQAVDGVDALCSLRNDPPDLVLLDVLMPRMGGLEFLNLVRANPRFHALPVFLMTAVHDAGIVAQARRSGIQEYLFKGDVSFMGILELIKRHLGEPFTRPRRGRKPKVRLPVEAVAAPGRPGSLSFVRSHKPETIVGQHNSMAVRHNLRKTVSAPGIPEHQHPGRRADAGRRTPAEITGI
jgi:CheY-like chemotaxis protein